jgi:uracil-DNA glycosylase
MQGSCTAQPSAPVTRTATRVGLFDALATEARACRLCADELPVEPRPVIQGDARARILIAGQAPGRRVHETGIPFNDPSGVRLREWLGIDAEVFYDPCRVALLPMGFCYPGTGRSGDLPPRRECAPQWRAPLLEALPNIRLTVAVGSYAIRWHLPESRGSLGDVVRDWREHAPALFVAPHPSPRNNRWLREHPWFEGEVVPALRAAVRESLDFA